VQGCPLESSGRGGCRGGGWIEGGKGSGAGREGEPSELLSEGDGSNTP
jgi:hypothetical protein